MDTLKKEDLDKIIKDLESNKKVWQKRMVDCMWADNMAEAERWKIRINRAQKLIKLGKKKANNL